MKIDLLINKMKGTELEPWSNTLQQQVELGLCNDTYGNLSIWQEAVTQLPNIECASSNLNVSAVTIESKKNITQAEKNQLDNNLRALMPWRKGPYSVHGIELDTEWRSDYKWDRLISKIKPLSGKTVLDVGCGNGYHGWRMRAAGANLVIGIDPSPLFVMQFQAINKYINDESLYVLPIGIEGVPDNLFAFDTVFSMGVFYHRKSPMEHLLQLKRCLKPGGELVLETLVIPGDEFQVLMPRDRYAQMRNVWFIPSSQALLKWLARCGFKNCKLIDETYTSIEEQRATEWMKFHSLENFLDEDDHSKTIEGYPAPLRAIFTAQV